jgi:cytochrome b561
MIWRTVDTRPASDPMPAWQQRISLLTVVALYALMLAIPLTGWLYNSAAGFPLSWFNLVNLPALTGSDPQVKSWAKELHETGAVILIALVSLHVLGALKHHFVDKDGTLRRMLGRSEGTR